MLHRILEQLAKIAATCMQLCVYRSKETRLSVISEREVIENHFRLI